MKPADYAFFKENGYISLGKILSDTEVEHFMFIVFDRDRTEVEKHWYPIGHYQTVNCDALLTSPEFDNVIRHPIVMDCLHTLMGNPPCFSEVCIRHMAPYDGELNRGWHRDGPRHWLEHPLRIGFMQLMLYLTDVDETTHCFSLSPESVEAEILETDAQLERVAELSICTDPLGQPYYLTSAFYTLLQPVPRKRNARQSKSITGIRTVGT